MTRETRIALFVGLGFIVLFGLVLGQRSLSLSSAQGWDRPAGGTFPPPQRASPEMVAATYGQSDRHSEPSRAPAGRRAAPPDRAGARPPSLMDLAARDARQRQGSDSQSQQQQRQQEGPPPPDPARRAPPPRNARTYTVQSGDTLIRIARKLYGREHENEYVRIFQANRDKLQRPSRLAVGQELVIPPLETDLAAGRPASGGQHYTEMTLDELARRFGRRRTYVVQAGDSLTDIARKLMGGGRAAVQRLHRANRDRIQHPDRLPVGLRLRIPDGA